MLPMRLSELDYHLPDELIAQQPAAERTASRLLVVRRADGSLRDQQFTDLPQLLQPGDLLVVNNTQVVPARFMLRRTTGGLIEGLWLANTEAGHWQVLLRGAGRLPLGEVLEFEHPGSRWRAILQSRAERGHHTLQIEPHEPAEQVLAVVGQPPLPPYIKRATGEAGDDRQRYQTVYAQVAGAVAAPTAGLHFDEILLQQLQQMGIELATVTLHVGLGTFQPVEVDDLANHVMHAEQYEIEAEVWQKIETARRERRRIVAVGTTTVRTLESAARSGNLHGWTRLLIYPPCEFQMTDALITNFHLPRSTLLAMIYAFGGTPLLRRAYQHAIAQRYRFFSYGDAMLIE
ncbi:MAG: S-adenosylmethionine:tRNA ribosyltransferase-isomerase [Phycisphaerae bacterium]|nr:S-adenosylmethionine:tRNA ribosyltransferase-isomerase [Phycisphaerae bacterium]